MEEVLEGQREDLFALNDMATAIAALSNLEQKKLFYDYERYGKLRMEKETGAFTEKGYVAYCGTLTLGELMAGGPAEQHQREQEFQMGGM